jgi:hypothetical protein
MIDENYACSFSDVIRVPVGLKAPDKLASCPDYQWKNLSSEDQLSQLNAYTERFMEGVKEESLEAVTSCLSSSTDATSIEFVAFASGLSQWEMVEAGIRSLAHL